MASSRQYAAKFVCGKSAGKVVAPGVYFTAINVHNPLYVDVAFKVKVAVALPGLKPGPVSDFHDVRLGPDEALEIDNPDIFKLAGQRGFLKGFVVIESETELDVVAVYTAGPADGQVQTLHTERVPARGGGGKNQQACVHFEAPLKVGTEFGTPAGNASGDIVLTEDNIAVSVQDFAFVGGGGTFGSAMVEVAPAPFDTSQSVRLNNLCLEFDFAAVGFVPSKVVFEYLDQGGSENLSVNGSPVFAGGLDAPPASLGGATVSVTTSPGAGGTRGTVTVTGTVNRLRVGGQEFWLDSVCAFE